MMPPSVAMVVANSMGMKMSVGCAAPICARYTSMLTGMSVRPEVLSTRNIIMGLEAVAFSFSASSRERPCSAILFSVCSLLCSCMDSMAFSPNGVAALSSPSMLALMFMNMWP